MYKLYDLFSVMEEPHKFIDGVSIYLSRPVTGSFYSQVTGNE